MVIYATKKAFERYNLKMPEEMKNPLVAAASKATIERESGDRLYDFLEGNVLQTKKPVHDMNFDRILGYKDENGSKYYEFPEVKFREAMIKRYGNRAKELHPPIGSPFAIH